MENETEVVDLPDHVHLSGVTARWILEELNTWWEVTAADSVHYTYHLTRALIELRSELGMEID